jgi:hypothetical protein
MKKDDMRLLFHLAEKMAERDHTAHSKHHADTHGTETAP